MDWKEEVSTNTRMDILNNGGRYSRAKSLLRIPNERQISSNTVVPALEGAFAQEQSSRLLFEELVASSIVVPRGKKTQIQPSK